MSQPKLRIGKLSDFIPQKQNANLHTERGMSLLESSMSQDGYVSPMTATADGEVIDGSARLEKSATQFANEAIIVEHDGTRPVVMKRIDIPSAEDPRAQRISLSANRIGELNLQWSPVELQGFNTKLNLTPLWTTEELSTKLSESDAVIRIDYSLNDTEEPIRKANEGFSEDERKNLETLAGYKTAIARTRVSRPMQFYEKNNLLSGSVLDYGSGQDIHNYPRFDPAYSPDYAMLCREWDTIACNYVLNVIPLIHNRVELLLALKGILSPSGVLLCAIYGKDDQDTQSSRGYQCGWQPQDWEALFSDFFTVERLKTQEFWGWKLTK